MSWIKVLQTNNIESMSIEEIIDMMQPFSYHEREIMYLTIIATIQNPAAIERVKRAYDGIIDAEIIEAYIVFQETKMVSKYDQMDADSLYILQRKIVDRANEAGRILTPSERTVAEQLYKYIKKQQMLEEFRNGYKTIYDIENSMTKKR